MTQPATFFSANQNAESFRHGSITCFPCTHLTLAILKCSAVNKFAQLPPSHTFKPPKKSTLIMSSGVPGAFDGDHDALLAQFIGAHNVDLEEVSFACDQACFAD